jgi:hypothetical protein
MSDFELPNKTKPKNVRSAFAPNPNQSDSTPAKPQPSLKKDELKGEEPEKEVDLNKEPVYDPDELLQIFDEIIFSGEYQEDYRIKNKLTVTFRTRTAEEINQIQKVIDGAGYSLISSVEMAKSTLNLQYALTSYNGKDLAMMKPEDRAAFVEKLSGPIVGMLLGILGRFDHKVASALREGEENF